MANVVCILEPGEARALFEQAQSNYKMAELLDDGDEAQLWARIAAILEDAMKVSAENQ